MRSVKDDTMNDIAGHVSRIPVLDIDACCVFEALTTVFPDDSKPHPVFQFVEKSLLWNDAHDKSHFSPCSAPIHAQCFSDILQAHTKGCTCTGCSACFEGRGRVIGSHAPALWMLDLDSLDP
jgi:hypothetical protein